MEENTKVKENELKNARGVDRDKVKYINPLLVI